MLLSSRVGLLLYLVLPNHWVWHLLSRAERARILEGNRRHNTERPDYADPSQYQGGVGFDSAEDPRRAAHRRFLTDVLDKQRPASVLEIGPGSGHLTRMFVEYPGVTRYVGVDINDAFLDHLRPHLASITRPGFSFDLVHGTVDDAPRESFDAIVLCSAVHHIPDRRELFAALAARLSSTGVIAAIDPTHYLGRLRKMLRKASKPAYLATKLREALESRLSTHAMCTLAEYRAVARQTGLAITRAEFSERPPRVERWRRAGIPLGPLWRWAAEEIAVEFRHAERAR